LKVDALRKASIARITVVGQRTGKRISLPVQFVYDEEAIFLLPFMGKKTRWYSNLTKNPEITIDIGGTKLKGKAEPSTDRAKLTDVIEKFKEKYGESNITDFYPTKDAFVKVLLAR